MHYNLNHNRNTCSQDQPERRSQEETKGKGISWWMSWKKCGGRYEGIKKAWVILNSNGKCHVFVLNGSIPPVFFIKPKYLFPILKGIRSLVSTSKCEELINTSFNLKGSTLLFVKLWLYYLICCQRPASSLLSLQKDPVAVSTSPPPHTHSYSAWFVFRNLV